ncbi:hypothetical protein [Nostoc sp.]|uniref:hypothetical protein n=1 Tax=Nostoc sp. TaxID=1180 RepID=UPI002FF6BC90
MKAITVKAPISWAIFNAGFTTLYRNEHIEEPNTQLVIHAGKFCTSPDVENFSKKSGLIIPSPSRFSSGGTSFGIYAIRDHTKKPYQTNKMGCHDGKSYCK